MREGSTDLAPAPMADSCGWLLTPPFLTKRLAATAAMAIQDNAKATMLKESLLLLSSPGPNGEITSANWVLLFVIVAMPDPERPGRTVVNPDTDTEKRGHKTRRSCIVVAVLYTK